MRNPARIDPMLETLERIWKANPDWRLGQVVANAVRAYDGRVSCDPFYIEDDAMEEGLNELAKTFTAP
jgi:hypothetical protein